jgi:hypothetical protein
VFILGIRRCCARPWPTLPLATRLAAQECQLLHVAMMDFGVDYFVTADKSAPALSFPRQHTIFRGHGFAKV